MDSEFVNTQICRLQEELNTLTEASDVVKLPITSQLTEFEIKRVSEFLSIASEKTNLDQDVDHILNMFELKDESSVERFLKELTDELQMVQSHFSSTLPHIAKLIHNVVQSLEKKVSIDKNVDVAGSTSEEQKASVDAQMKETSAGDPTDSDQKSATQGTAFPQLNDITFRNNLGKCTAYAINTVMGENSTGFNVDQVFELLRETPSLNAYVDNEDVREFVIQKWEDYQTKKKAKTDQGEGRSKQD